MRRLEVTKAARQHAAGGTLRGRPGVTNALADGIKLRRPSHLPRVSVTCLVDGGARVCSWFEMMHAAGGIQGTGVTQTFFSKTFLGLDVVCVCVCVRSESVASILVAPSYMAARGPMLGGALD